MTTLALHPPETARKHVLRLRRMRRDGIVVCVRQALVSPEGGDLVEFVPFGERRWLVAMIDAKSPGPEGAEIAREVARHLSSHVLGRVHGSRHTGDLMASANDAVFEAAGGEELVSAVIFLLDGEHRTIRIANAGQIEPLAAGRAGSVVTVGGRGPALGLLRDQGYRAAGPLRIGTGMVVLAVTDGVHDAVDREGNVFGREGTSRALSSARELGPRAVVRRVLSDVAAHGVPEEADDRSAMAFAFPA